MNIKSLLATLVVSLSLAACGETSSGDQYDIFKAYVGKKQIGSSPDYWLEKKSVFGPEWDIVTLIFGFPDDSVACQEFLEEYQKTYQRADLRCSRAN